MKDVVSFKINTDLEGTTVDITRRYRDNVTVELVIKD